MRVLYVSHTAVISGGERSLLNLLGALPDSVQPSMGAPAGPLQQAVQRLGIPVMQIAGTAGSLRPALLDTPRALAEMSLAAVQVRRAARRSRAQLVHANSIRAGIVLGLAPLSRLPSVVHVRDCLPPGALTSATMRLIAATATTIVANSRYTADWVRSVAPAARAEVVHNAVDLERFDPAKIDRAESRARLGAKSGQLLLGVVAQLTPWKGQDTAIEALKLLRQEGVDAHLLLVGSAKFIARSTRFDNTAYEARLRGLVEESGLRDSVSWLGEREDVPELVRALDVLLLPSWEEPFGRALIEAMALEVPVIATNVGGPSEIIEDGREGFLLAPRDPRAWAGAVGLLAEDRDRACQMGRAGRLRVQRAFGLGGHVTAMLELYERAIARADGAARARR